MAFNVSALGFGDNVVDRYEHIHTMYPGGNAVNFAVYAKKCGAARSAYMGIFGNDAAAEHVIASLEDEDVELAKCKQLIGENGAARVTVVDGDRVFLGSNDGGIRGDARYVLDRFDLAYMKQFDVVHSGNYCFTERELPKLKAAVLPFRLTSRMIRPTSTTSRLLPTLTLRSLARQTPRARTRFASALPG